MNCATSLALLSDFRDGLLNEPDSAQVRMHLLSCRPCDGVFRDIDKIAITAAELREESFIALPDEEVFWRRFVANRGEIH